MELLYIGLVSLNKRVRSTTTLRLFLLSAKLALFEWIVFFSLILDHQTPVCFNSLVLLKLCNRSKGLNITLTLPSFDAVHLIESLKMEIKVLYLSSRLNSSIEVLLLLNLMRLKIPYLGNF